MKPFLLLGTRENDAAARGEYESVRRHAGLRARDLHHVRVEAGPLPAVDLEDYSGIIIGGGPFNASDDPKSALQKRVERELNALLSDVIAADYPLLGLCYGVGLLATALGGVVDDTYAEEPGAITVTLTDAGRTDPVLAGIPDSFGAFTGHKEACTRLPEGVVLLATGDAAPNQIFRCKTRVWVTQFHPELDARELGERMRLYQDSGYFRPDEYDALVAAAHAAGVTGAQHAILKNFVAVAAR